MKKKKKPTKITQYRRPLNINLGLIIFGIIFIYIIYCIIAYFTSSHITPYEVSIGELSVNNTYSGLVLREEKLVPARDSGYVEYRARESGRVAVGSLVYTVDESGRLAELTEEKSALNADELSEVRTEIINFQHSFNETAFESVYDFKFDLEGTVLKLSNYNVLSDAELAESGLSGLVSLCYAEENGIVVYNMDGYEDVTAETFTADMLDEGNEEYERVLFHTGDLVAAGDTAYKLITDENWSVIIALDEERAEYFRELVAGEESGSYYVQVRFLKNGYEAWANMTLLEREEGVFAKLDFNNSMITFATERFLDIELLTSGQQGLKIPNSSIVEKEFYLIPLDYITKGGNSDEDGFLREVYAEDGTVTTEFIPATIYNSDEEYYYVEEEAFQIGQYILKPDSDERYPISKKGSLIGVYNINKGYADFKQITILAQNEEYAIVKSNTEYGLSVYDHIVLDGTAVSENQFIFE